MQEELGFVLSHPVEAPLMVSCTSTVGRTAGHTDVSLWYVVHADRHQPPKHDGSEFNAVRWFPLAEVPPGRSDPHMSRFLSKLGSRWGRNT
jgi:8-oxo-dGTP diphosphatase